MGCGRALFACLLAWSAILTPAFAASTSDARDVDAGRSLARAVLIFRDPGSCGPIVRAQTCLDDLANFVGTHGNAALAVPNAGPEPYDRLRAFILTGDATKFDRALGYINTTTARPGGTPRSMQLTDAGIAVTLYDAAVGNLVLQIFTMQVAMAAAKTGAIDDLALFTPDERAALQPGATGTTSNVAANTAFAGRVDAAFPATALPQLTYDASALGFMRLGVALTTMREFLEQPPLGATPESMAFVNDAFARIEALAPSTSTVATAFTAALRSSDAGARNAAAATYATINAPLFAAIGKPSLNLNATVVGAIVAQVGYNAAVIHDPAAAQSMVTAIGAFPLPEAIGSPIRATISALQACPPADFACERAAGLAFARLIEQP